HRAGARNAQTKGVGRFGTHQWGGSNTRRNVPWCCIGGGHAVEPQSVQDGRVSQWLLAWSQEIGWATRCDDDGSYMCKCVEFARWPRGSIFHRVWMGVACYDASGHWIFCPADFREEICNHCKTL